MFYDQKMLQSYINVFFLSYETTQIQRFYLPVSKLIEDLPLKKLKN